MIVYPATLLSVITPPLWFPRFGYQTWLRDLLPSDITVSDEYAPETPKDAPLRPDTAEFWQPASMPATWEADLGALRDVDYVGIAAHSIGSNGATLTVETSDTSPGVVWTQFSADIMPADDAPILLLDQVRSVRAVRITLTGGTPPQIAVIYAGVQLAMQNDLTASGFTPLTLARETVLHQSMSRGGQFLGQGIRRMGVSGAVAFQYLDPDWYRANFDPFVKAARRFPYFFGWWPDHYASEVGFVWTEKDIRPTYMGFIDAAMQARMEVKFAMTGIGNE